ncbi:hypothetical protein PENSPDRAFT_269918 [Peniophora sp. CONT]|nr:hypothetical protein PENSPDRAFT_269918 [Peniophora sp. CONT]
MLAPTRNKPGLTKRATYSYRRNPLRGLFFASHCAHRFSRFRPPPNIRRSHLGIAVCARRLPEPHSLRILDNLPHAKRHMSTLTSCSKAPSRHHLLQCRYLPQWTAEFPCSPLRALPSARSWTTSCIFLNWDTCSYAVNATAIRGHPKTPGRIHQLFWRSSRLLLPQQVHPAVMVPVTSASYTSAVGCCDLAELFGGSFSIYCALAALTTQSPRTQPCYVCT